jgi:hypothetical protein
MRNLAKGAEPAVLNASAAQWALDLQADPTSRTRKYRYRHPDIKAALVQETGWKCIYCESKIGHNTPGDIEHKIPSSLVPNQHFQWENLSVACTECNRRKNNYLNAVLPFLDPYNDDVEARVRHYGPTVGWAAGDAAAEVSVRTLELHNFRRTQLLNRKIEKIEEINNLCARILSAVGTPLESILKADLLRRAEKDAEYSGMVKSILATEGLL